MNQPSSTPNRTPQPQDNPNGTLAPSNASARVSTSTDLLCPVGGYSLDSAASFERGAAVGEGNASASHNGVNSAADFLKLLYGNVPSGWVEITYLAPEGAQVQRIADHDPEGKRRTISTVVDWRPLPLGIVDPRMKRLHEMNERGYGVHFGVGVRRERKQGEWRTKKKTGKRYWCFYPRGRQADALYITALWAEVDAKDFGGDLDAARQAIEALKPSILIFSGAGWHGYWLLDEPLEITDENRADVKRTLRGIAKAAGGDSAVADLARVMRLPGFKNTKPGRNGVVCELVYANDNRYSFSDLFITYAPLITVAPKRSVSTYVAGSADEDAVIEALNHIPASSIPYSEWITVLAALRNSFDEATAISIGERWSGSSSYDGEIEDRITSFDGGYSGTQATLGSVFFMAERFGYQRKTKSQHSDQTISDSHDYEKPVIAFPTQEELDAQTNTLRAKLSALMGVTAEVAQPEIEPVDPFDAGKLTVREKRAMREYWDKQSVMALDALYGYAEPGITVTSSVLREAYIARQWHVSRVGLFRSFKALVSVLIPIFEKGLTGIKSDTHGENWFILPTHDELRRALRARCWINLHERYYRPADLVKLDFLTGDERVLPAIPADLSAEALESVGVDADTATSLASALMSALPYDVKTSGLRESTAACIQQGYDTFCKALDDETVINPSADVVITDADSHRRADLRAWHMARIPDFSSHKQQCRALGCALNTLKSDLLEVGIVSKEHTEEIPLDLSQSVEAQIHRAQKRLKGRMKTLLTETADGKKFPEKYTPALIKHAIETHLNVTLLVQTANDYEVGDVPNAERITAIREAIAAERKAAAQERAGNALPPSLRPPKPPARLQRANWLSFDPVWVQGQARLIYRTFLHRRAPDDLDAAGMLRAALEGAHKYQRRGIAS